jgi:hypothetical protein
MGLSSYNRQCVISTTNGISIGDHLGGFNCNYLSPVLTDVVTYANELKIKNIATGYVFNNTIKEQYPDITFCYVQALVGGKGWENLITYNTHPEINFKNFVCSFNGSPHVGRKLLVSVIEKFGWFDPYYCSKNFQFTSYIIDGHLGDLLLPDQHRFYNKFFISNDSDKFFNTINSFGHVRYNHEKNIYNLEDKLTKSWLHIVSETMATSYYPFVTEKFLYSIVTRGLFLSYAQPGWHAHVEKYYGFKRYTKLFDYRFDSVKNPVERVVELMTMISKFSRLSADEWKDLYLIEQDTIEYNYNHYFSGNYLKNLSMHV